MTLEQHTIRALYKKLLALYPRAFREQFAESMEQTFNDRWNEWNERGERGWLGFVLGVFLETAIGIIQEHAFAVKGKNPMKRMLATVRFPALIGFLIILPFMLLEFTNTITNRRDAFSEKNVLDFTLVFGILWFGVAAIILMLMPFVGRRAGTAPAVQPHKNRMDSLGPRSAAIIGFFLGLPFATILPLLLLGIEPAFAAMLSNPNPDQPNVVGSLVVIGAFVLAVLACIIVRAPVVQAMQTKKSLLTHPVHLALGVVMLGCIGLFVGSLIIDQFPCWVGVPNCD